ncbi:MAG: bifunctional phosphopantothenoylcysteine decarboxylase/phosphopantothenate--cysteine ligase CoaBC [Gammaproteobacteria bacterium]|nr:bifunctional phosphopantothenoylcysteine decarboxylase/phosphopantothenate--cysteine ligase CoaBC [Gammaproteobacteria bacterium]
MSGLEAKKILLGVTGGIAAYKSAVLLRELQRSGASVRVVMTAAAQAFIAPLTFQALTGHAVSTELLDPDQESSMSHIELARWADLILVAPASADFMARLACGLANDLLSTLCLATQAPIKLAAAMNQHMWFNPATRENCRRLEVRGVEIWGPDAGLQACGEVGPGRMLEPEDLLQKVVSLYADRPLQGVRVLMTAGPTREPIDPVRFIGNRSSGHMGYALAQVLCELGAEICLVSGPVVLPTPVGVERVDVETATQMQGAVMARVETCDIFIGVAAVADYRPLAPAPQKIKKTSASVNLELVANPDILAEVAALEQGPFTVGFAAETEGLEAYAEAKRISKGVDLIAANHVGSEKGGFESDENALLLLWDGGREALPMMSKIKLAEQLGAVITKRYRTVRG